jgi:hypothetical protein
MAIYDKICKLEGLLNCIRSSLKIGISESLQISSHIFSVIQVDLGFYTDILAFVPEVSKNLKI